VADPSRGISAYEPSQHVRPRLQGKGNINTPLDFPSQNHIDRFSLAINVIDRVPKFPRIGGHAKEEFRNLQIKCKNYAYEHGIDDPDIEAWK
jgi:xylulose-5-phosphate/fructose-6-phosphate phosphoketolase